MLYVDSMALPTAFEWHVGEVFPRFKLTNPVLTQIHTLEVQADGDELEYIKKMFSNVPMTNRPVVTWTGEFAKFILMNIK